MNDEKKTCYETSEQNLFTRFETKDAGTYVLPYASLLFVHLSPRASGAGDILTLTYTTHAVTVRGDQLSPLLLMIQKGRADTIRVGSGQSSGVTGTPTVRDITVTDPMPEKSV